MALCGRCRTRLRLRLTGLMELLEECGYLMSRPPAGLRERVSGTRSIGIDLDDRSVAARTELTELAASWARLLVDEHGIPGPSHSGAEHLIRFLTGHLDRLSTHPAAADFLAEMTAAYETLCGVFGPPPAHRISLGTCPLPGCARQLQATVRSGDLDADEPGRVACEDGHRPPPQLWLHLARRRGTAPAATGRPAPDPLRAAAGDGR